MATYGETSSALMASQRLGAGGDGAGTYEQWKSALYAGRRIGAGGDGFGTYGQWQSRDVAFSRLSTATDILAQAQLSLDFTANTGLLNGTTGTAAALLSTTRASAAQMDDNAGNWTNFAINAPRLSNKGLLVEATKTNSIRNNTMVGGVNGSPGTQPTNWSGLGNVNGLISTLTYGTLQGIDGVYYRLAGTAGAGIIQLIQFDASTGIAAVNGQTWTSSFFWQVTAGAIPAALTDIRNVIRENTSGGVIVFQDGPTILLPTTTFSRNVLTATLSGGGTVANAVNALRFSWPAGLSGLPVDFTIFIGWPQLEQGGFASSPIKTSTVAVTRASDTIDVTGLTPAATQGTLFAEYLMSYDSTLAEHRGVTAIDDGTTNNRLYMWHATASDAAVVSAGVGGSDTLVVNGPTMAPYGTAKKIAGTFGANDGRAAFNGALGTADTFGAFPAALTAVRAGRDGSGILDGYLRRLAYWPTRLSNTQMQAITA